MREILFRGQHPYNTQWEFGYYVYSKNFNTHQIISEKRYHEVDPKTVGQYIGLTDINGVKIFEGDIIEIESYDDNDRYNCSNHEVYFDTEMLEFGAKNTHSLLHCQFSDDFKVIGNIYDNPELLNDD